MIRMGTNAERDCNTLTPTWLMYGLSGKTVGECQEIEDHWRETGEVPEDVAALSKKATTEKIMCWDDIEWLRRYVEYVQNSHPEIDEYATEHADKENEENEE